MHLLVLHQWNRISKQDNNYTCTYKKGATQMNLKIFTGSAKTATRITVLLAIGSLLSISGAARAATMTIFQKSNPPVVVNLSSVKDISFAPSTAVGITTPKAVTFSLNTVRLSGKVLFRMSGQPRSSATLKLFSASGRLVSSQILRLNECGNFSAAVPRTVPGIYIARFTNEKHTISQRVITY
jgi:hypothetical protein